MKNISCHFRTTSNIPVAHEDTSADADCDSVDDSMSNASHTSRKIFWIHYYLHL